MIHLRESVRTSESADKKRGSMTLPLFLSADSELTFYLYFALKDRAIVSKLLSSRMT